MKVEIHPTFVIYLLLVGMIDRFYVSICLLLTLIIHEAGHLVVGRICGERYASIQLTPFGGMIKYKSGSISCKGIKGIMIAAAGPASNASVILLFPYMRFADWVSLEIGQSFILMNISMLLMNLIPVLPLDGGRIVFSAGYYLFPVSSVTRLLAVLGKVWGIICIILSFAGALKWGKLNITLLAAGGYISICAGKQRAELFAGNLHTIIQERYARRAGVSSCKLINVHPEERITCLIPILSRYECIACTTDLSEVTYLLSERLLLETLLKTPSITFSQIILENKKLARGQM